MIEAHSVGLPSSEADCGVSVDRQLHAAGRSDKTVAGVAVVLAWGLLVWMLWPEWRMNPQYAYGVIVPLLAIYLFWLRWQERPAIGRSPRLNRWMAGGLALSLGSLAGLAVFLHTANPGWRLLGWLLGGSAVVWTLLVLHSIGRWQWLRHFVFPVGFMLVAVPWPRPFENRLMHELMHVSALTAAELVRWMGIPAEAAGNVIRLPSHAVGVDEACSGIRSLSGALMMGLFWGEWFALENLRRVLLTFFTLTLALVTNLLRTVCLVIVAQGCGSEVLERWHDPAGLTVLTVCMVGNWAAARGLGLGTTRMSGGSHRASLRLRKQEFQDPVSRPLLGTSLAYAFPVLLALGLSWVWSDRETVASGRHRGWSLQFPHEAPGFQRVPISTAIRSGLRFDEGEEAKWEDDRGRRWHAFQFHWYDGKNSWHDLIVHDPAVCLTNIGMKLVQRLEVVRMGRLVIQAYEFRDQGQPVYVYNCVTELDRATPCKNEATGEVSWRNRWDAAVQGRRSGSKQRFEFVLWGANSPREAEAAFREQFEQLSIKILRTEKEENP